MHEPVVSKFASNYLIYGFCGAVVSVSGTSYMCYFAVFGNPEDRWGAIGFALFLCLLTTLFFYFFLKGLKKITVGPAGIIVDYLVSGKQLTIPYTSITHMGTYRGRLTSRGRSLAQSFVIEYGNRSINFSANYYDNYDELKAGVYNYTLGFDRHRSQY